MSEKPQFGFESDKHTGNAHVQHLQQRDGRMAEGGWTKVDEVSWTSPEAAAALTPEVQELRRGQAIRYIELVSEEENRGTNDSWGNEL